MHGLLLAVLLAVPAAAGEAEEARAQAEGAWRAGRLDDAASLYRYTVALSPDDPEPSIQVALTLRDAGRETEALPLWVRASLLRPEDPSVWEGKAWALARLGRYDEARDAFVRAASTGAWTAAFGRGLVDLLDGQPGRAAPRILEAAQGAPRLAAPYVLLGRIDSGELRWRPALERFETALELDPLSREAREGYARAALALNRPEAHYQARWALWRDDPTDARARETLERSRSTLSRPAETLVPARSLSWPTASAPADPGGSSLRLALFADAAGQPAVLRGFAFVTNGPFRVLDARLGEVAAGDKEEAWRVVFDPATGVLRLESPGGRDSYGTSAAVELAPVLPGTSVVLKSVSGEPAFGRDLGDREVKGRLRLEPVAGGFLLTVDTAVEDYLRGTLSAAYAPPQKSELLKAAAVALRARTAARLSGDTLHPRAAWQACDSRHCGVYLGVQEQHGDALKALKETQGSELTAGGRPALALEHESCGGRTEEPREEGRKRGLGAVADTTLPFFPGPLGVERLVTRHPAPDLVDLGGPEDARALARWVRVLEPAEVEERLKRRGFKGRLRRLTPGARSATGRLLSLRAVPEEGEALVLEGHEAIEAVLSPGTLRSTLFSLHAFERSGKPALFVLWGAGTGHGLGLCRAGAEGLAARGLDHAAILRRYFPAAEFRAAAAPPPPEAPRPAKPAKPKTPAPKKRPT